MLIELHNIDPDSDEEYLVEKVELENEIEHLNDLVPLLVEHGMLNEGDNLDDLEMGDGEHALFILKGDDHIATVIILDDPIIDQFFNEHFDEDEEVIIQ